MENENLLQQEPVVTPSRPRLPSKSNRIVILLVVFILGVGAVLGGKYFFDEQKIKAITDFGACKNAGYPVMKSYPEKCGTPNGRTFVQKLSAEEQKKIATPTKSLFPLGSYEDKKQGYSFQYPTTWVQKLAPLPNSSPKFESPNIEYNKDQPGIAKGGFVFVTVINTKKTLEQIEESYQSKPPSQTDVPQTLSSGRVVISGKDAVKSLGKYGNYALSLQFVEKGKEYMISCNYVMTEISIRNACNQILSTFKFL